MKRNLRLIPIHAALTNASTWMPVFVLFTRARFDLGGALALAAIYYFSVVLLEVPSGWASDRKGRVVTLRVAALAWVFAHVCFLVGDDSFAVIAIGQALLAAGYASLSGTEITFHYDTLETAGRAEEFAARASRVASIGFASTAVSALVGGALGLIDLRWGFVAALVLAVVQLGVTMMLTEPPAISAEPSRSSRQLLDVVGHLRNRTLGWLFFYGVLMVILEHGPYEVLQPWLTAVLDRSADEIGATPLLAGAMFAVAATVGALVARTTPALSRRLGAVGALLVLAGVSATVVTVMALTTAVAAIAVVAFRSVQSAIAPVIIAGAIAPRVPRHHRATLLSINSLAGRLGWGVVLAVIAAGADDRTSAVLARFAWLSWALVALVILTAVIVRPGRTSTVAADLDSVRRRGSIGS